jgi:hypothetical protein
MAGDIEDVEGGIEVLDGVDAAPGSEDKGVDPGPRPVAVISRAAIDQSSPWLPFIKSLPSPPRITSLFQPPSRLSAPALLPGDHRRPGLSGHRRRRHRGACRPRSSVQEVIPVTSVERVVAIEADQVVVARAAAQGVPTEFAKEPIVAVTAVKVSQSSPPRDSLPLRPR